MFKINRFLNIIDQYKKIVESLRRKSGTNTVSQALIPSTAISIPAQTHYNILLSNPQVMHNLSSFFQSSVVPSGLNIIERLPERHSQIESPPPQVPRHNAENLPTTSSNVQQLPQLPPSVPLGGHYPTTKAPSPPQHSSSSKVYF